MISTLLYYSVVSSAVLFYGIGIDRTISIQKNFSETLLTCFKALFSASATTAVCYILTSYILIPIGLSELYPFVTLLIFILFTTIVEIFVGIGMKEAPIEFSIPLLSTFLGLNEGITLSYAVLIAFSSIISFYILIIVFHSVEERISFFTTEKGLKTYCVLLLCLAILIVAITGFNVTWFNICLGGSVQ